ncbi:MAG TPA: chromate resistance protein ChrB domain-containing protein [Gemmatimonadales bacterium]|nr:chromate resistance protein ChrB domain-containing protein [Gemmatimonadales bacterium]
MKEGRWLLLIHQLPPKPDYFRVKVWRRLQGLGAIAIKNSVWALPFSAQTSEDFQWLRKEIVGGGGEASLCRASFVDGLSDDQIESLFRSASDAAYAEVAHAAEQSDVPAEAVRLERRLREIAALDHCQAAGRKSAELAVSKLKARKTSKGPKAVARSKGRTWITRPDVHVDRIASAWLIKRFIDPKARFAFGEGREGAVSFDMFEGDYTHDGDHCTFETLLARFGLESDDALRAIAELVHDVDCKDAKFGREETAGFSRMIAGIVQRHARDEARIARGAELLNDLYESMRPSPPARSTQN